MRFVPPKSENQQARAILFRNRERLLNRHTELVNGLRSTLYEFRHTVPQGIGNLRRGNEILEDPNCDLPDLVRQEFRDLFELIELTSARTDAKLKRIKALSAETETAKIFRRCPALAL